MNPEMNKLQSALEKWDIKIEEDKLRKFDEFMKLLLDWNLKMNLTAIKDPKEIVIQHFMDSISPIKLDLINDSQRVIDVGTGAGFPGIPLKIMRPEIRLVLLDSLKKRTEFLQRVIEVLQLEQIEIIHERAEQLGQETEYREQFDIAISRAVAPLRVLAEYCLPFVKKGSYFISYKGPAAENELIEAENALKILGAGKVRIEDIYIPYSERQHRLIVIQKITKTSNKYPRNPAKVKKSPL